MEALGELFATQVAPDRVAAIIIEPVLGEGGFVAAPPEFLRELRAIADREGIVLICDEVQSGFGRTGKMFACEHAGIEPDLIAVAKSVGGGLPISAVIGKAEIMDAPAPGGLGGTYAGNPVACAAALATLDIIDDAFLQRSEELGRRIFAAVQKIAQNCEAIVDVRGLGAMVGIEFSDARFVAEMVSEARNRGLLLLPAGSGEVIRVLVPLTITDQEVDIALNRLEQSCRAVLTKRGET